MCKTTVVSRRCYEQEGRGQRWFECDLKKFRFLHLMCSFVLYAAIIIENLSLSKFKWICRIGSIKKKPGALNAMLQVFAKYITDKCPQQRH